jgi:intracellular multiplication protein IcmO
MLVSLMPDAEGDNAMWKERAVSLISSLMPILTYRRDAYDIPMSVGTIRQNLSLASIIKLSRDENLPNNLRAGLKGYLETLPGYNDAAFDDEGRDKPAGPDQPMMDTTTAKTQHGYLSMQFTRSLQSLADDYGYIFDSQAADVDMVDVVLNRRILVVLIPALEKSGDEAANLGKIVAANLKGMMGSALGANVEGDSASVIENKPTNSATPFMTIFDEVGYYAAQGMAVMAAQARSLGFSMIFSAQDLPALEKRVKEEARSIAANCNIKIFGKLEDPTQTKEFFEKTVGSSFVTEVSGFSTESGGMSRTYSDNFQASVQDRGRAGYDGVRSFGPGQAVVAFGEDVIDIRFFYTNLSFAKAMRVTRYVSLPPPDENAQKHTKSVTALRDLMVKKGWTAMRADVAIPTSPEIQALVNALKIADDTSADPIDRGVFGLANVYAISHPIDLNAPDVVEQPAAQTDGTEATSAAAANPMGFFSNPNGFAGGEPDITEEVVKGPISYHDLLARPEPEVNLDEGSKNVLEEAARKARESIFRSDEDKKGDKE